MSSWSLSRNASMTSRPADEITGLALNELSAVGTRRGSGRDRHILDLQHVTTHPELLTLRGQPAEDTHGSDHGGVRVPARYAVEEAGGGGSRQAEGVSFRGIAQDLRRTRGVREGCERC
jgi:hypothetical protein